MMILSTQVATRASDETLKLWDLRQTKTAVHTADGLPSRFSMTDCCFRFYSLVFFLLRLDEILLIFRHKSGSPRDFFSFFPRFLFPAWFFLPVFRV